MALRTDVFSKRWSSNCDDPIFSFFFTVFTQLCAAALFKFLVIQMWRLFEGGVYLRAVLFEKIIAFVSDKKQMLTKNMKYTHFEPKNIVIQESKFPRLVSIELYRNCFLV